MPRRPLVPESDRCARHRRNLAARLQRGAPAQLTWRTDAGGVRCTTNERGLSRLWRSGPRPHPTRGGDSITPTMRTDIIPGPKLGSTSPALAHDSSAFGAPESDYKWIRFRGSAQRPTPRGVHRGGGLTLV